MFEWLYNFFDYLIEIDDNGLLVAHMLWRSLIAYAWGISLILLNRRFINERSSFDIFVKLIIGSALASAMVGASPFFATLIMVTFIIFINWLLSVAAFYSPYLRGLLSGRIDVLYQHGEIQWKAMQRNYITREDLLRALRSKSIDSFDRVDKMFLEKNGEISIILK